MNKILGYFIGLFILVAMLVPMVSSIDNLQTPIDYPYDISQERLYNTVNSNVNHWDIEEFDGPLKDFSINSDTSPAGILESAFISTNGVNYGTAMVSMLLTDTFSNHSYILEADEFISVCFGYKANAGDAEIFITLQDSDAYDPVSTNDFIVDNNIHYVCNGALSTTTAGSPQNFSIIIEITDYDVDFYLYDVILVPTFGPNGERTAIETSDLYVDWATFDYDQEPEPNIIYNLAKMIPLLIVASALAVGYTVYKKR